MRLGVREEISLRMLLSRRSPIALASSGCDATKYTHFTTAELQGKVVPDEHTHEHATCFNVKDRGLVVITSCGHVGISRPMWWCPCTAVARPSSIPCRRSCRTGCC